MNASITCTRCQKPLGPENLVSMAPCFSCGAPIQVDVFPALFRPAARAARGETALVEGESTCFYHAQTKAVVPCDSCGRFLCALCDVELSGQHLCPACVTSGKQKGRLVELESRRVLYDTVAFNLAVVPLLMAPLAVFTSPAAIYMVFRHWHKPLSILPRSKTRFVLAVPLAILSFGAGVWMLYVLYRGLTNG